MFVDPKSAARVRAAKARAYGHKTEAEQKRANVQKIAKVAKAVQK